MSRILKLRQRDAVQPRLVSREDAARYCGCSTSTLDDWARRGIVPGPVRGTRRWDLKAIDAALDRLGGLAVQDNDNDDADAALQKWMSAHDSNHP